MNVDEFRKYMAQDDIIEAGSETFATFHALSQQALEITTRLNSQYHAPEEMRKIFSELIGAPVPDDFGLFPPFYTDCGKNIHIGRRVFINAGCMFQDQGGIYIDDGALIGHNVILATLNHEQDPKRRQNLLHAPIHIGKNVWIGARATILAGVTIGDGAIVAAGAIVNKNVEPNTIVAGIPAKKIKDIKI